MTRPLPSSSTNREKCNRRLGCSPRLCWVFFSYEGCGDRDDGARPPVRSPRKGHCGLVAGGRRRCFSRCSDRGVDLDVDWSSPASLISYLGLAEAWEGSMMLVVWSVSSSAMGAGARRLGLPLRHHRWSRWRELRWDRCRQNFERWSPSSCRCNSRVRREWCEASDPLEKMGWWHWHWSHRCCFGWELDGGACHRIPLRLRRRWEAAAHRKKWGGSSRITVRHGALQGGRSSSVFDHRCWRSTTAARSWSETRKRVGEDEGRRLRSKS